MVAALPVQQQTAVYLYTCGVIAIALTYHFARGDSIEKLYFVHLYCTCLQPEGINMHENDTVRLVPRVFSF